MGMTTKSGKYFANPALGRAHEASEGGKREGGKKESPEREKPGDSEPPMQGGAHSVHIFRDEAGGHHVAAHHPHGVEHSEHGSLDEAMDHAKGEMEGAEGQPEGEGQVGAPEASGLMSTLGGGGY